MVGFWGPEVIYLCCICLSGYPSDGIVQVEEEEEAQAESDNETYTIEDDFRQRQRTRKFRAPVIDGSRLQRNTATVDPQGNLKFQLPNPKSLAIF